MLLNQLQKWIGASPLQEGAHEAYITLMGQSRKVFFYRDWGVPDTLDGRFDLALVHLFLLLSRLKAEKTAACTSFCRELTETYLADMDRSLREMGVGDMGVGRRVQAMASAFYGRLQAYESAAEDAALQEALRRNVYGGAPVAESALQALTGYVRAQAAALAAQPAQDLCAGRITFTEGAVVD